jgi:hypothetical protein
MRHDYETCNCAYCTDIRAYHASLTPEQWDKIEQDRADNIAMVWQQCDELRAKRGIPPFVPRGTSIEPTT